MVWLNLPPTIINPKCHLRLRVNQLLKNHALVPDRDLSYEIFLAKLKDHSYGPLAEAIKHSIG